MTRSYSRALVDEAGGCHLSVTEPSWQGPSTLFRRAGLFSPAVTGSVRFRFQGDSFADGYGSAAVGGAPRSYEGAEMSLFLAVETRGVAAYRCGIPISKPTLAANDRWPFLGLTVQVGSTNQPMLGVGQNMKSSVNAALTVVD